MLCTELSRLRVGQFISIHPMARHFNPSNGAAGGPVVVDVTSGDTGNTGRDRKIHQEILESQRYPEIIFTPSRMSGKVEPEGDSKVQVDGIVRLHGSDHVMTLGG
jgi:polyisoprenoid-binding protein YceI